MASPDEPSDLTKIIGTCGLFQVAIVSVLFSALLSAIWGLLFMVFGLYNPGWTCLNVTGSSNTSSFPNQTVATFALLSVSTSQQPGDLDIRNITDWNKLCSVKESCQHLIYNTESSTIVTEWDLSCGRSWISSIIISVQMSGVLIGAYLAGQVGDKFGRKASVYGSVAVHGIGHLIAPFVPSWQIYAAVMFIIGMGAGGILVSTFVFPFEFLTAWWRGIFVSIPVWNIGCAIFALTIFLLRNWKYVHLSAAGASVIIFLTIFWTPESVRWLAVTGKVDKAKRVVARIAKMNSRPCPDTSAIDEIAKDEKAQMGDHKYTYLDLFRMKGLRYYSITFGITWVIIVFTYYMINYSIKSFSGNFYINLFIFSVFDIPIMMSVSVPLNKIGRRKSSLLYTGVIACLSASAVVVLFAASGSVKDTCVLVLAVLCKGVILGAWNIAKVFSSELYPTVVRSLHYGYLNAVSRLGAIISPYILSDDPDMLYLPFLVIFVLYCFVFGMMFTLPETKGRELQDRADVTYSTVKQDVCVIPDDQDQCIKT